MNPVPNHRKPPSWLVDRRNTDSLKWRKYQNTDILPLWVADMDFRCAEPIIEALHKRVQEGIFGYGAVPPAAVEAVMGWLEKQHQWHIEPDWIVWVPGLVSALHIACRAFTEQDEHVLTFTPVYPPFLSAPRLSGRSLIVCPLNNENGHYRIDFHRLQKILTDKTRLLILCSPHNPIGRVWTKDELLKIIEICSERNILLCSDEIHCDLILDKSVQHIPTAALMHGAENRIITLMSPAKTFNLPGLSCGFAVIPDIQLRRRFIQTASGIVPHVNVFGYTACAAAFSEGLPWLQEVLDYLRENHRILYETVNETPGLSMGNVQATYLAWIDVSRLNLSKPAAFFEQAGVGVMDGADFGQAGFVRLNFACNRDILLTALDRIKQAVTNHVCE
ncbi:MAG TPA: PatB family C-S lyase [Anaerohalosphaeraceae bacterium]|nr:PatB family C-S lyase [Anaerohalosphaeraceae bacterium]HOL30602.1 PatB family C-S lyase [Anaerohalosphaeraceae bacterium]HPC63133.1 PatB family C-S lyase [Anaerohalosphaeraceae bacterium]HPO68922.1 PatB family C-S lyase [Anaerohalosphaeraceae bacterium]HRS71664.1 PatB family C-S lyase [Anaerohalosphaeraceae bacterium]